MSGWNRIDGRIPSSGWGWSDLLGDQRVIVTANQDVPIERGVLVGGAVPARVSYGAALILVRYPDDRYRIHKSTDAAASYLAAIREQGSGMIDDGKDVWVTESDLVLLRLLFA